MKKQTILLCICLVFALSVRVILLDRFPIGITHDELNYVFTAKSLFLTHKFPPGTAPAILPTAMSNFTVTVAEVPSVILSFLIGSLSMSLFGSRVVGAIFSVSIIWAVYLITLHITRKRTTALISAALMAINPWSFLMGRTVFEVNFFVAFFLWGFFVLVKSKGWKIFYALPLYLLGFFSYTGGQISFCFFILITLLYHYFAVGKNKKELIIYAIFIGIFSFVFAGYVFAVTHNQSYISRGAELYLPDLPEISSMVDVERKLAVPDPYNKLFINKATVYVNGFIRKYLNTFSVNTLFLDGEVRAAFSYQKHGTFYLIDFIFVLIGISSLLIVNKKAWILFLTVILGASLTSGLSTVENSYSQRVGLIFPFLVILSAVGVDFVLASVKPNTKKILFVVIAGIYLISFAGLAHLYFLRFPVYASDGWFFQDRVLSTYIKKTQEAFPKQKVIVYTSEPKIIFEEYLFYTDSYNRDNAELINDGLNRVDYYINNKLLFTDICPGKNPDNDSVVIFDGSITCSNLLKLSNLVRITRLRDVFENYLIYNDKLCNNFDPNRYVDPSAYRNFSIEKQNSKEFCHNWITRIE